MEILRSIWAMDSMEEVDTQWMGADIHSQYSYNHQSFMVDVSPEHPISNPM